MLWSEPSKAQPKAVPPTRPPNPPPHSGPRQSIELTKPYATRKKPTSANASAQAIAAHLERALACAVAGPDDPSSIASFYRYAARM
jgi:hypothetical protein